jgi:two-component system, chemotaxis family, CheB/CheR fusion protein
MQSAPENDLTIVAIGASAGGIEALSELMSCLPVDTGMAFVLVLSTSRPETSQHAHGSARQENGDERKRSLRRYASEPNHVFVIPPNTTMSISSQTLHLSPREESHGLHMPIDHFLRALAEQKGNRAVGVILIS